MSKHRIYKLEKKLFKKEAFTEYPIFIFKENEGYIVGDFILSKIGIDPSSYEKSKIEENSRVIYSEDRVFFISGEYLFFNNNSRGLIVL